MPLDLAAVTITQLTYALAVDRTRHFGRAAEDCAVTQPTLSMQIKKLEETLGVVLFDRSRKPVEPTDIGREIIRQASDVIREVSRFEDIIHAARGEVRGEFRLGIIPTLSPYLLPLFIDRFERAYPAVTLHVEERQTDVLLGRIADGQADAALLATPTEERGVIEHTLFFEPFQVYAAAGHPLLRRKTVQEGDLPPDDIWLLDEGHCLRNQTLRLCDIGSRSSNRSVRFEAGSLETLIRMVSRGSGYTLVPYLAVESLPAEARSNCRPFRGSQPGREISLVFTRAHLKRGIIEALETTIAESLPGSLDRCRRPRVVGISPPS